MKKIKLEIKDHSDRMAMLEALQSNGYDATIKRDTAYMPPKTFIVFKIKENNIECLD